MTADETAAPTARDAANWAQAGAHLAFEQAPEGAINLVAGKRLTSPIQGFGRLWQKTYRIRLTGATISPAELIALWKAEYGSFWPKGSRFYGSLAGIKPGETALLNLDLPGGVPVATGILVLYADDESFTFMTPEGHGFAAFITFSAATDAEDGATVATVTALLRAADPLGEIGMLLFLQRLEDRNWTTTLRNLAARAGATEVEVTTTRTLVDPRRQWRYARNIRQNSAFTTIAYKLRRVGRARG